MNWYMAVVKQYAVFDGRARRKEYWLFLLFHIIIMLALSAIDTMTGTIGLAGGMGLLTAIYALGVLLPAIGVTIRRLHDTGRVGWWILVGFVPLVGGIILLVLMALPGNEGDNRFGAPPPETPPL